MPATRPTTRRRAAAAGFRAANPDLLYVRKYPFVGPGRPPGRGGGAFLPRSSRRGLPRWGGRRGGASDAAVARAKSAGGRPRGLSPTPSLSRDLRGFLVYLLRRRPRISSASRAAGGSRTGSKQRGHLNQPEGRDGGARRVVRAGAVRGAGGPEPSAQNRRRERAGSIFHLGGGRRRLVRIALAESLLATWARYSSRLWSRYQ